MTRLPRSAASVVAAAGLALLLAACGSSKKSQGPAATNETIQTGAFKVAIQSVDMPTTAGAQPVVTFRVTTANDAPVDDLVQRIKNGAVAAGATPTFPWTSPPRFTIAHLDPTTTDFTNYYTVTANGQPYTIPGATAPSTPVLPSATQATYKQPTAANPTELAPQGNGTYKFTFPALPAETSVDTGATHRAGVWATNHESADADAESATSTLNFVPNGNAPVPQETVTANGCNRCHAPAVSAHDERLGTQVCLTCHSPQTTDPETGNTVDLKVMIHRIHFGAGLPSATGATGQPYRIVGFRQNVSTFNESFINDVRNCALCHQGTNADQWKTNASFAACTSCHDNVRFDASAPIGCTLGKYETAPCNHPQGISPTTDCRQCHTATAPEIGVEVVHVPLAELAKQFKYDILDATPNADRTVTLTVAVRKPDNSTYDLTTDPAYTAPASSLNAQIGWATQEFTNEGSGASSPGQPIRVAIAAAGKLGTGVTPVAGQAGVYQVTTPPLPDPATAMPATIAALGPSAVTSASVHLEGHPVLKSENIPVPNVQKTFPMVPGGAVQPRRQVIDVQAKCDNCHGALSAHGANRNDMNVCVVCHNPRATDAGRRVATATNPLCQAGTTEQPIDFKVLIHEIHSGDIRKDDVTICGFNSTPATFPGRVVPHGVDNCNLCHVNDSWNVPDPANAIPLPTTIGTNGTSMIQTDDVTKPRVRAVCTACHDQVQFADETPALPPCNTLNPVNSARCLHSAGAMADDSRCFDCHQKGEVVGLDKVHNIH